MPYHLIPRAVKIAGIKLWERNLLPLETILDVLEYSRSTFFRTLKLWHETGDVVSHTTGICGRLRTLNYDNVQYLLLLVEQNPTYFLDKLLDLLKRNRFITRICAWNVSQGSLAPSSRIQPIGTRFGAFFFASELLMIDRM